MLIRFIATENQLINLALNVINGSGESLVPLTNSGYNPDKTYKLSDIESLAKQFLRKQSKSTISSWFGRGIFILFFAVPKFIDNGMPELGNDNTQLYECAIDSGDDNKKFQTWLDSYGSLENLVKSVSGIQIKDTPENQIKDAMEKAKSDKDKSVGTNSNG